MTRRPGGLTQPLHCIRLFTATCALLSIMQPAAAQAQGRANCRLRVTVVGRAGSTTEPRSNMLAIPDAPGRYETHLSGGLVMGRCGDATMTGDSAVHLEHRAEAQMIGSVRYRDSTRVLDAERVTYYGLSDRVVAQENVRLERLQSGATLEAPRVEFYRTPLVGNRTLATGRPHMTLPTGGPGTEPFLVDADFTEFIGEEQAFARGNVEIRRTDLDATADSARFDSGGLGVLYGRPVVRGEAFTLTGDSVMARFADDELREVRAFGAASASGRDFELQSELVTADIAGGEVERLWAFGDGRSIAASGEFQLAADSLDFGFTAGVLDSIGAVGEARSVETLPHVPGAPLTEAALGLESGDTWLTGDTIRAFFITSPADSLTAQPDPEPSKLIAIGSARSFHASVRDSLRSLAPSQNYMLGSRIEILFRDGEPVEVVAQDAIGVYLEPDTEGGGG